NGAARSPMWCRARSSSTPSMGWDTAMRTGADCAPGMCPAARNCRSGAPGVPSGSGLADEHQGGGMSHGRAAIAAFGAIALGFITVGSSQVARAAAPAGAPAAGCEPDGPLNYVCGPVNAEDLVRLGNTRWLVTSGMDGPLNGGAAARGHLYLVDHGRKTWSDWFPGASPVFRPDTTLFKDCPGPVDPTRFSAHGLAVREQAAGRFRLYIAAHGAREAIEVFDIDARGAQPSITWTGCVVLPEKVSANSVAIL